MNQDNETGTGQRVPSTALLDLHFSLRDDKTIIMSQKIWGENRSTPDQVKIIHIPLEIIERIKNGEVVKWDGFKITPSSETELCGVVNVPLENKVFHARFLQDQQF